MSWSGCAWTVLLLSLSAQAASQPVVELEDPANDAFGPGSYVRPLQGDFQDGDFDLRRFSVRVDGNDAIFEITLGAPVRRPEVTQRTNESSIPLDNGLYLQNIDIYLDTDRTPGSGFDVSIPGRHVAFPPGQTWETAIVLTPQPGPTRAILQGANRLAAAHVYLPQPVQTSGRTLTARVPLSVLGGPPRRTWGYSVQLSGASWERNFSLARRAFGASEDNAFTMEVTAVPEEWSFGGAPQGNAHPRVIDVLLPPEVTQQAALGGFDEKAGTLARVPFVYPEGGAPPEVAATPSAPAQAPNAQAPTAKAPAAAPATPSGPTVVDVTEELVSIANVPAGVQKLQFARVVDAAGATVSRIMIMQLSGSTAVAQVIDGRERVARGAKVAFDRAPAAPTPR